MKTFKQLLEGVIQPNGTDKIEEDGLKDACWKGYEAIGTKKKNGKTVPNCVPVKEEALDEGKMGQLHADIEDHLGKHVANYKKMGGAEHLAHKTDQTIKHIAKLHNISHEAARKHVNDYVDNNLKEETDAEKAAKELKLKLTKWKNQQRAAKALGEAEDKDLPFTPDKPHSPIAKAGKHGYGPSAARHLARMGLKKLSDKKQVKEEIDLEEAIKIGSKVTVHAPGKSYHGVSGHVGEIRNGAYKGAPKSYTVYHGEKDAIQLDKKNIKLHKEDLDEAVDKEHPIYKEYQSLKKQPLKDLKDQIKRQHRVIDTSEFRSKEHAVSHILHNKHGAHRMKAVFGEETEQIDEKAASGTWHVHDSKSGKIHSTYDSHRKAINAMKKLNSQHDGYETPGGIIQSKFSASAASYHKEETELDEAYRLPSDSEIDKVKAHVKANHPGKSLLAAAVHKKTKNIEYVVKDKDDKTSSHTLKEAEQIDEASRTETGELFKSLVDRAHAASEAGNHTQAKRHLANAQTARYGILSKHMNKHQASFDKYKELKHAYTNSDEHIREEALDEISKDTLNSYVHKSFSAGNELHKQIDKEADPVKKAELKSKLSKRNTGVIAAAKKIREDVPMLSLSDFIKEAKCGCEKEELHPNQKKLDKNKNGKLDSDDFVKLRASKKEVDEKYVSDAQRKAVWASKNEKGVKEEVELDEAMTPMQKLKDALDRHSEKAVAANKAGDHEAVKVHQGYMNKIKTKMGKLAKNEEVDLQEMEDLCELSKGTLSSYVKKAKPEIAAHNQDADYSRQIGDRENARDSNRKAFNREKGVNVARAKLGRKHDNSWYASGKIKVKANEEVEQIDEISKATLASYIPKAAQSARFSGMTAQDMQNRSDRARNKSTKDSFHRLSMKYKNKAWDREDNIKKAAQKLAREEVEQLAEADIAAIRAEYKKNESDNKHSENAVLLAKHFGSKSDQNKANKAKAYRDQQGGYGSDALGRHHAKMSHEVHSKLYHHIKEEAEQHEETSMLTFKQLMENISEGKIDDLKDKIAARKATQSAYDKDYKPAAKSSVTKVKGHSYGAGEEEGEDDEDDNKKVIKKPAAPVVKRGRGRPAGSKSGARR